MSSVYNYLSEIEEILETVSSLRDKTLEHYHENTSEASRLIRDLSSLEEEAHSLMSDLNLLI